MKEKQGLETELQQYTQRILILEASIDVSGEKLREFQGLIKTKKNMKNVLFSERDELVEEKRSLQKEKFDFDLDSPQKQIVDKISFLSESIGDVIEKSKALSLEIQGMYDQSQVEYKNLMTSRDKFNLLKKESNLHIISYNTKIANMENDLNVLRSRMSDIQEKLAKENRI